MFYMETCSTLTGGPSCVRNSEVRCHRALILCGACSSRPYAPPITWFSREICSPLTEDLVAGVIQKCGVIKL